MEVKDVKDFQDEIQYCPVGRLAKALKADALAPERLRYKDCLLKNLIEYFRGEVKRQMSGGKNRWICRG
ncbi:hypothetical protein QR685DRAFT_573717 [Neurospora intermedia]|uniref:Uncharacterized protein n=1 Tax=Neurospora intermedia TaxID=5142 RepID=A0ABR3D6X1_NEUIN